MLVDDARPRRPIAIVAFGDDARVVLEPTPARDGEAILRAIDDAPAGRLDEPRGRPPAGLRAGPRQLDRERHRPRRHRLGRRRQRRARPTPTRSSATSATTPTTGIQLVAIGVGMGNYNDVLLEQLADQGDGFYAYVNGIDEARRLFRDDLTCDAPVGRPRRQGPGRVRPATPSTPIASSATRTGRSPTTQFRDRRRRRRRDRRRPRGHRAVRRPAAGEDGPARPVRDGPAALDRPGRAGRPSSPRTSGSTTSPRSFDGDADDVPARRARRRDRRGFLRDSPWGGRLPHLRTCWHVADELATTCRGPRRSTASSTCSRRRWPSTLSHGAPVRGAARLSAGAVEERRRPTPVRAAARVRSGPDGLALARVVRHGIRARRCRAPSATLGVGSPGMQLPGTAVQDARATALSSGPANSTTIARMWECSVHARVDHVGWPEDGLAGRDPEPLVADERPSRRPR